MGRKQRKRREQLKQQRELAAIAAKPVMPTRKKVTGIPCCALCLRQVTLANEHHMVPRSRGGRETETLCLDCHAMIHTLFTNKELEKEFNSVESLLEEPRIAKYVTWVRKRPGTARYKPKGKRKSRR